jgi:hypothetical protein
MGESVVFTIAISHLQSIGFTVGEICENHVAVSRNVTGTSFVLSVREDG